MHGRRSGVQMIMVYSENAVPWLKNIKKGGIRISVRDRCVMVYPDRVLTFRQRLMSSCHSSIPYTSDAATYQPEFRFYPPARTHW